MLLKQSYESLRIRELDKDEVKKHLSGIIIKDIMLKGISKDNLPSSLITDDIQKMILTKYSILSPIEVELALQMDRYDEFEEKTKHYQFYGTEYVAEILKKYCSWKQKKAQELNLSRKTLQIENKPDLEKIESEYLESILSDLRQGKTLRYINSNKLYKSIPNEEKLSENQRFRLFKREQEVLIRENERKKEKIKDVLQLKQVSQVLKETLKSSIQSRCENVATCIWLAKKHNIKLTDNQF